MMRGCGVEIGALEFIEGVDGTTIVEGVNADEEQVSTCAVLGRIS